MAAITVNGVAVKNNSYTWAIYIKPGVNNIAIKVTAQDGITIRYYQLHVYVPLTIIANNILSPNGDGKNDTWYIENITQYPNNSVSVFDRSGRIIYSKQAYANDWDGTYKGTTLTDGTYYYIISVGTAGADTITGFVTIVNTRR